MTTPIAPERDLARTVLQLATLVGLIAASLWIVRPFLAVALWAITISVATWPLFLRIERSLGHRRRLAASLIALTMLVLVVAPVYQATAVLVRHALRLAERGESLPTLAVPAPPAWLDLVPVAGGPLTARWREVAAASPEELASRVQPFARTAAIWFVGQVGNIGLLLVQLLLTLAAVVVLYVHGDTAATDTRRLASRLAGTRGEASLHLAAQAVRAVALGVVVTAVVQTGLSAIGLAVAGVPFVPLLTAAIFMLAVAQIGAAPVLLAAVAWVYARKGGAWGTGFLAWAVLCSTIDNVLRPVLIRRGADLPLLLIFAGVIGGLIAFGVIGLFIGPVVLAVAYTLLREWVAEGSDAPTSELRPAPTASAGDHAS